MKLIIPIMLVAFSPFLPDSAQAISPTVGTIVPAYGTSNPNETVSFTTTYIDLDGWANILNASLLINTSTNGANCFYGYYNQNTNKLYLRNDANTRWLGGYTPGSANVIENSYARLNCAATTVSGLGATLTINWSITFKSPFTGTKGLFLYVMDDIKLNSGWVIKGKWTIRNQRPSVGTIIPSSGASAPLNPVSFTTTYNDPDGWLNIQYVYLLINTSTARTNCFYGYYNQNTNKFYLRNDANTSWLGGYSPGSVNVIKNSYARLNCASTTVSGLDTTLTVNWNITFKPPFAGTKNTYLYVRDDANTYAGYTQVGTWTIDATPPTGTIIINGNAGYTNSSLITLTLSATDTETGVTQMQFSNDNVSWSDPELYNITKEWDLSPGDGIKTIYARFKNGVDLWSTAISDDILLDTTPPQITITTPLDGALTNQVRITVTGTYIEANLNTITVNDIIAVSADGTFTIENVVLVEGDNTIAASATDLASNTGTETIHITLDTNPPQNPSISIEEGGRTDVRLIHLLLSAEGAAEMIVSENEDLIGASWEPYAERREYELSEGEGLKRIYIKFRDMASNETSPLWANIILGHLIRITSPQDGLTINATDIAVLGVVNGEDIQIYINGLPARIVDNTFYINQFPLQEGTNTITAQAYMRDELLEEANITVLTEVLTDPVQITANPLSGEPDIDVSFTAATNISNPITNYAWDFDNDGRMDWTSIDTGNTSYTYSQVRLYHPTIRVTDTNGTQYADTVTINVYLPRELVWTIAIEDPIDLAVDGERNLYILQRTSGQVQKYDMDGNHLSTFGGIGQLTGQFNNPSGIALDQDGNIYIADTGNNRIQKLTSLGEPDITFSEDGVIGINIDNDIDGILDPGTEPSQFNQPYGIAVDYEGNVYVTDTGNNRIQKFSSTGEFLLEWEVNSLYGIAVDLFGDIYIADRNNNQVQIYSSMGSSLGTYNSGLFSPTDTALTSSYLYIADTGNNLARKINRENLISDSDLYTFASGEEVDSLSSPVAIALDNDPQRELIYIADSGNNRVVKIELRVVSPTVTLDAMKAELSSGDIQGATNYFTEDSRDRYQEVFNLIRDDLPEAISDMNDVHPITIQDNYAEYIMVREEDGEEYGYFITFAKDENGEWRIAGF